MKPKERVEKMLAEAAARGREFGRYLDAITKFRTTNRDGKTPEDLLPILRRYNSVWESSVPSEADDLPGFVRFFPSRRRLVEIKPFLYQPFFYRLNFIRQLSTIHLWTDLEAGHSRLAHSLGVVQCAEIFLDSLERSVTPQIEDWERKAVLIYAFIHDCFHGPMGHSLELMRDVFAPNDYRGKLDKYFLGIALADPDSTLRQAISSALGNEPNRDRILAYLQFFCTRGGKKSSYRDRYFLSQIVDSKLDADRIDYIFRDSHHLGLPPPADSNEVFDIIENIRVVSWREEEGQPAIRCLSFSEADKAIVEKLLARRRELYVNHYEQRAKLIVDEMICRCLYHVLLRKKVLPLPMSSGPLFTAEERVISEITRLTDSDLFHFVYEAGEPLFAQMLVRDVLSGKFYQEIYSADIDDVIAESAVKLSTDFEHAITQLREDRGRKVGSMQLVQLTHEERLEVLRHLVKKGGYSFENLAWYFMFVIWLGGFTARLKIEKLLWDTLLSRPSFERAVEKYYVFRFGPMSPERLRELKCFPVVHISVPSYVATRAREVKEYTKELSKERLLFRDANEKVLALELDLNAGYSRKVLFVMLSAPAFFRAAELKKEISDEFVEMVKSFNWADEEWLRKIDLKYVDR